MPEIIKVQTVRIRNTGNQFVRLTYKDKTVEDFEIIRSSIAWPQGNIPGLILIGGLPRGTEAIRVLEETPFKILPEAEKMLADHKAKYSTLNYIYYQDIPASEGFVKYFKDRDQHSDPFFKSAPHTDNIDFDIQLIGSYLADKKLKVPGEGILATELQTGWDNISSEKNLHGVIALACLISGIQARDEGFFPEDCLQVFPTEEDLIEPA